MDPEFNQSSTVVLNSFIYVFINSISLIKKDTKIQWTWQMFRKSLCKFSSKPKLVASYPSYQRWMKRISQYQTFTVIKGQNLTYFANSCSYRDQKLTLNLLFNQYAVCRLHWIVIFFLQLSELTCSHFRFVVECVMGHHFVLPDLLMLWYELIMLICRPLLMFFLSLLWLPPPQPELVVLKLCGGACTSLQNPPSISLWR